MIKVLLVLVVLAVFIILVSSVISRWFSNDPSEKVYWCACGCDRKFRGGSSWDGYHGPGYNRPVVYDPVMLTEPKPKAIEPVDKPDDYVLGWQDIEWTVKRRLPDQEV